MLIVLPDELEILRCMQPLDRDVFNYLAERVDYESGVIGKARRVSYGGMAYDLSEHDGERRCPSSLRKLTIDQVRNSVRRLIRQGLLRSESEKGKGNDLLLVRVFWVDVLGLGHCDQKPDARQMPDQMTRAISFLQSKINTLRDNNESSSQTKTRPDAITSFTQHTTSRRDEFSMTMDWQPSADEFEIALFRAGFSVDKVDPVWIAEFVMFWSLDRNRGRTYSQKGWTLKLAMAMVDYLRDPGLYARRRGITPAMPKDPAKPRQSSGMPEWARPPRDDEEFCAWLRRCWSTDGPVGITLQQTRNWIRPRIESRLQEWRKMS